MKKIIFMLLSLVVFIFSAKLLCAQETLKILTYYPAPYGEYTELKSNFYRDFEDTPADGINDPQTYYIDPDGRSQLSRISIGLDPGTDLSGFAQNLFINGTTTDSTLSWAAAYVKMDIVSNSYIYAGIYGEAGDVTPTTVNYNMYGIYSKCSSTESKNRGVYGKADDSASTSYGALGEGDEYGVRGKGDFCGAFAMCGSPDPTANSGICTYVRTIGGESAYGVYGSTNSAPPGTGPDNSYFGGCFVGDDSSGGGNGLYTYSEDGLGIKGESDHDSYYGAEFSGYRNSTNTSGGGIRISVDEGTGSPEESPEIVCADRDLTIRTAARDGIDYGRVTVFARGKDCLAGIAAKENSSHNPYPYLYLKTSSAKATKYIVSAYNIEFEPGVEFASGWNTIHLRGSVYVGTTLVHSYSDLAEVFELKDKQNLELGDVVVIDEEGLKLRKSTEKYDSKVAGVISSEESASMVMGLRKDESKDKPLALKGRVLCKVDASYGEIKPGDFLVTSPTPGYAMKAEPIIEKDGHKIYGQGIIIGKAMEPLKEGKGKILILVCLM